MNKVLFVVFVFLQSTFLACCNGCSQSPPASHNKDYGMSRYMENNDDEGWD